MEKDKIIETNETLYSLNKNLCKEEPILTKEEINNKLKDIIIPYCEKTKNTYYTLLNRERYDFTVFHISRLLREIYAQELKDKLIQELIECLNNRGQIISIDETEDSNACEIWIKINEEPYVYYFFAYDNGIIKIEEIGE